MDIISNWTTNAAESATDIQMIDCLAIVAAEKRTKAEIFQLPNAKIANVVVAIRLELLICETLVRGTPL